MVRLRDQGVEIDPGSLWGFNSNMVRLRAGFFETVLITETSFNSNMVRLRERGCLSRVQISEVSIPIWFD